LFHPCISNCKFTRSTSQNNRRSSGYNRGSGTHFGSSDIQTCNFCSGYFGCTGARIFRGFSSN
jgi:hypothetical protein